MSDKINYSIVHKEEGNISVQSTVKSFNLDHVTEKDIVSFYSHFSQYAAWDTGLLPVDGTGTLSIRTAGTYSQFAYQHKPGLYHVNWAAAEGAPATAYYVAQPYRIIICDMEHGNLLGARMFYSPYPITHPTQKLYHVNLPNINCKGYRGNGVGWICLYRNEDWSELPLNERISRFIERCSGVETYNDANMSETDGTRFYIENNKPSYLSNPTEWQDKSNNEGYAWTLDESLWIPVLVESMDNQDRHDPNGQHLTFADALVGDYQAYYHDSTKTKPINAVIRPDKELASESVLSYFALSYNSASKKNSLLNNTFQSSEDIKNKTGSSIFSNSSLLDSPTDHTNLPETAYFNCDACGESYEKDEYENKDYYENSICQGCFEEYFIHIKSVDAHFNVDDDSVYYVETSNEYYHKTFDTIVSCDTCGEDWADHGTNKVIKQVWHPEDSESTICQNCVEQYAKDNSLECYSCNTCKKSILESQAFEQIVSVPFLDYSGDEPFASTNINKIYFCNNCKAKSYVCPCGILKNNLLEDSIECPKTTMTVPLNDDETFDIDVFGVCKSCAIINFAPDSSPTISFTPVSFDNFNKFHVENYNKNSHDKNHSYSYDPVIDYDNPF
jgi:hypothetical protein